MDFHKAGLKKLNDRRIDVSTYDYDSQTVLIEGRLVDHRHVSVTDENPPGSWFSILQQTLREEEGDEMLQPNAWRPG